jgi:hypothetical protein
LMVYNTHKNGKWDVGSYCFTNIVDNWPTPWNGQMALSLISSQSIDGFERQGQLPATIAQEDTTVMIQEIYVSGHSKDRNSTSQQPQLLPFGIMFPNNNHHLQWSLYNLYKYI